LGRILSGGAKGPGLFFILPCVDNIVNLDLRTVTFDVNFEFEVLIDSQLERNPLL
jgi:regulator of protease activity HflC (stomatin/prohibitin superfamily)